MGFRFLGRNVALSNVSKTQLVVDMFLIGIQVKADKNNTGPIYMGGSDVSSSNGYILYPSETTFVPADKTVTMDLFFIALNNGDSVSYFSV
jgi:hypothetical protein